MITGEKVENILKEAWEKFLDYYNEKAPQYRKNCGFEPNGQQAKDAHWICWDEYDLTFHIGRFFYDILSKKKKGEFSNIEIHFEKTVNRINFGGRSYEFEDQLDKFKEKLQMKGLSEKPKVDIIVAQEDSCASFLLCAEVKCFRYSSGWKKAINDDIEKLKLLKDCKIAKEVVFILFDDYYAEKTANKIRQRLSEIERDGIKVLFYPPSKAKLREM